MTITMNVGEAKARFSELLDAAVAGERVLIARAGTPLVELTPVTPPSRRELGFMPGNIPDEFFAPLASDDLDGWM
ncbi:MAG: type II toxin-antitoxin system prevent-host-death family antitoxin [Actinomycetia bacterium]|nr:type II toxin-antitoxin system prevent-host-death family antitoxin [Actinomycetes bacterium]